MFTVRAALEGLAAAELTTRPDRDAVLAELQTALDALGPRIAPSATWSRRTWPSTGCCAT